MSPVDNTSWSSVISPLEEMAQISFAYIQKQNYFIGNYVSNRISMERWNRVTCSGFKLCACCGFTLKYANKSTLKPIHCNDK